MKKITLYVKTADVGVWRATQDAAKERRTSLSAAVTDALRLANADPMSRAGSIMIDGRTYSIYLEEEG